MAHSLYQDYLKPGRPDDKVSLCSEEEWDSEKTIAMGGGQAKPIEEYGSQARTSITRNRIGIQVFPIHSDCAITIRTKGQSDRLEGSVLVHR